MFRTSLSMSLLLALLVCGGTLAGCQRENGRDSSLKVKRLRVSGSSTALAPFTLLVDHYASDEIEFIYLPGLHSGGGIKGVNGEDLEIGLVSRHLTAREESFGLEYLQFSDDGVALAVNPSVTVDGLTSQQVREIYSGTYKNWKELGGPDLGIVILDRAEDEAAKISMREYLFGQDLVITPSAVALSYESDMVAALRQTEGAIGYFSLGLYLSQAIPVRVLALDGTVPSVATIRSGAYEVVRPLGIVVAPDASPEIAEFVEWLRSPETTSFLADKGFAPPVNP